MFQDEARFGRISDTRYCGAPRPVRPLVKAMLAHQHTYAHGAVSPLEDRLVLGLRRLERQPAMVKSIAGRDWIINSASNAN